MAVDINNFKCGRACYCSEGPKPDQVMHFYGSASDTLVTIASSAYFNIIYTALGPRHKIRKGDLISVKDSSDDAQIFKITSISPNVTIAIL